jgi:hypothetical protein
MMIALWRRLLIAILLGWGGLLVAILALWWKALLWWRALLVAVVLGRVVTAVLLLLRRRRRNVSSSITSTGISRHFFRSIGVEGKGRKGVVDVGGRPKGLLERQRTRLRGSRVPVSWKSREQRALGRSSIKLNMSQKKIPRQTRWIGTPFLAGKHGTGGGE